MQDLDKFKNEMNLSGKNVYVGHRYVPKIFGDWDNTLSYEPLSIVQYQGNSFTSRQHVPSGVEITDEEFWVSTGNYNAQIEQYRQDVRNVQEELNQKVDIDYVDDEVNLINEKINQIEIPVEVFGAVGDGVTDDSQAFKDAFAYVVENHLTLSTQKGKTYIIDDVIIEGASDFGFNSKGMLKRQDDLPKPPTPLTTTKTLIFRNCKNFYISEIHLDGNHYNNHCYIGPSDGGHSSKTGYNQGGYGQEWRHSVAFQGCKDFKVDYIEILNPSGDGVSFAQETERGIIGDIYGKSVDQFGNPIDLGRNLVTMANGVKDVTINSVVSLNIGHYYMPGGLDIEPDNVASTHVENIYINHVHVLTGGSGGVGLFDAYDNGGVKNITINNVYCENYRTTPGFPLLISGVDNVVINNAHTIERSMRGYSVQIGRSKVTKNIYIHNLIAEGGMLGIYLNPRHGENINVDVEFRNTKDSMVHFGGVSDGVNINIKKGTFQAPENVNRVFYFSPENESVKNLKLSGSIPQKNTNGGKMLFQMVGIEATLENIRMVNLEATGWIDRARELDKNTFTFNRTLVTNFTIENCLGITAVDELLNAKFMAVKGTYINNLNPTILTDDQGEYVIKGWLMTETDYFIADGNPIEDKIYFIKKGDKV